MKQASPFGKGALITSLYGRRNLGTRINNEGIVPSTLRFRLNFEDKILLRGGGGGSYNTQNYTITVLLHV